MIQIAINFMAFLVVLGLTVIFLMTVMYLFSALSMMLKAIRKGTEDDNRKIDSGSNSGERR